MMNKPLRDRLIILSLAVFFIGVGILGAWPELLSWAFPARQPLLFEQPEQIDEARFAQMIPAEHLAEAKRLWAKRDSSSSKRHLDAIPRDSKEYEQARALSQAQAAYYKAVLHK